MYFDVGNSKLTRRVKKLCKERNLPFQEVMRTRWYWSKYYEDVVGYEVPDEVYNEVVAGIEMEEMEKRRKVCSLEIRKFADGLVPSVPISNAHLACKHFGIPNKRKKDVVLVPESLVGLVESLNEAERLHDQLQVVKDFFEQIQADEEKSHFRNKFPNASNETVDRYFRHRVYVTIDDVPLDLLTANEIAELGLIAGSSSKVLISDDGAIVTPLHYASLPKYQPSNDLSDRVARLGLTPQKALWIANKLIKIAVHKFEKGRVYAIKDRLLDLWSEYIVESRFVRDEFRACDCVGHGCDRCDGTGIYSSRTLYEHILEFPNDTRTYSFHSFRVRKQLSTQRGADKRSYGYRFTAEDRRLVSQFHFEELIQIMNEEVDRIVRVRRARFRDRILKKVPDLPAIDGLGIMQVNQAVRDQLILAIARKHGHRRADSLILNQIRRI